MTAVSSEFISGIIDGCIPQGEAPSETEDLVGKRVMCIYGDDQIYEHVYLTPRLFTWLCLRGPEVGLADTEATTVYRIRDGLYLFSWREKVIPCGASLLIDLTLGQTCGALLGWNDVGSAALYFTWGARLISLGTTDYPPELYSRVLGESIGQRS
jgi:hypothetical protein